MRLLNQNSKVKQFSTLRKNGTGKEECSFESIGWTNQEQSTKATLRKGQIIWAVSVNYEKTVNFGMRAAGHCR